MCLWSLKQANAFSHPASLAPPAHPSSLLALEVDHPPWFPQMLTSSFASTEPSTFPLSHQLSHWSLIAGVRDFIPNSAQLLIFSRKFQILHPDYGYEHKSWLLHMAGKGLAQWFCAENVNPMC